MITSILELRLHVVIRCLRRLHAHLVLEIKTEHSCVQAIFVEFTEEGVGVFRLLCIPFKLPHILVEDFSLPF